MWTIEDALKDESLEKIEKTNEGFSFWLKGIPTEISVVLSLNPLRGGFNFTLSHYIKTPVHSSAYRPSRPWGDNEGYALHLAVTAITQHFREAAAKGFTPSSDWLKPDNKNY